MAAAVAAVVPDAPLQALEPLDDGGGAGCTVVGAGAGANVLRGGGGGGGDGFTVLGCG